MNSKPQSFEGYARLPEDLLNDLLVDANAMVERVEGILLPAIERRDALRAILESQGLINSVRLTSATTTLCGVDGGFAVERTSAVDLQLSVAVGVEGMANGVTAWDSPQYLWWSRIDRHELDNERLCRGIMVAQELSILAGAPHQVRVLDGSHLTLVIQLNSALTSYSDEIRSEARRVWTELDTPTALSEASANDSIIAMPKYDSSRDITSILEQAQNEEIPGDDKHLLSMLLRAGEYTSPRRVPASPWAALHFNPRAGDEELGERLRKAIEPLKDRELFFVYFKPDDMSPAFRIEIKPTVSEERLNLILSAIAGQMTGPFVREPYPQYLADVMAKSVGLGLTALKAAVQLRLSGSGHPGLSEFLAHSYRTEGV